VNMSRVRFVASRRSRSMVGVVIVFLDPLKEVDTVSLEKRSFLLQESDLIEA
jgi:hypothetical protein